MVWMVILVLGRTDRVQLSMNNARQLMSKAKIAANLMSDRTCVCNHATEHEGSS